MKCKILLLLNLVGIFVCSSYSQITLTPPPKYRPPLINYVKPNKTELGKYEKLELTVVMSAGFKNPFDPDDITLDARIKCPDGKSVMVPGFYYQEFQRTMRGNKEDLVKYMESGWKVRYTPTQLGKYTYYVIVQDKYRVVRSDPQEFTVIAAKNKGFVKVSKTVPYYFQMDNGDSYFPIGHNVCWSGAGGTYEYDKYFDKMSAVGENYTRLWMIDWSLGLEYPEKIDVGFGGLGRYHLGNAYKLDYLLEQAEKKGIYIMLCLDSFSDLKTEGSLGRFKNNSYSANQLGPCEKPEEFFTNDIAKQYYKKKLRYLIARYGYSTHLLAWELWNEVDLTDNYNSGNVTKWHQEMARYIRENDPYHHLITTSFADSAGDNDIWNLPEIDIVQTHLYSNQNIAETVNKWCIQKYEKYKKPHLFGEIGLDVEGKIESTDSTGTYIHNAIWSAAMSHCAGTPMSWWWDNYIEPNNLYPVYSGLAKFIGDIDWVNEKYEPLENMSPKFIGASPGDAAPNLQVLGYQTPIKSFFWVHNNGYTWYARVNNLSITPVKSSIMEINGLTSGHYKLDWYTTDDAKLVSTWKLANYGKLTITIPEIRTDLVARLEFISD